MTASITDILARAHAAAQEAVRVELDRQPEDFRALDCGFAWVTIGGREPMAAHCRKAIKNGGARRYFGDKGYPTGWQFWCPGNFNGQSIRVFEKGAAAFRDELAKYGIRADVGSRLD